MDNKTLLEKIRYNVIEVANQSTALGASLWKMFMELHQADIADFFSDIDRESFCVLFLALPKELKYAVFKELPDSLKVYILGRQEESDALAILNALHADELTDLFDYFSDDELRKYMNVLNQTARERVLSLRKFHPESAGGIMDPHVFSLKQGFTVGKSVSILQRLKPDKDIYQRIYVTDENHRLLGCIDLQDLVLHGPKERISSFMKKNELILSVDEDREKVAHQMIHYGLTNAPVVAQDGLFLGVVPADTLADVLVEEAGENVQRISAMTPLKKSYFETPFLKLLYERSGILVILLLVESISGTILEMYESTLGIVLLFFIPMIISTGGNTSSQTSAVAIQGMAAGEIRESNMFKFLRRELRLGAAIGSLLSIAAFGRVFLTTGSYLYGFVISLALGLIVMLSVALGSLVPLVLKKLNIDPAFSAGPFLATAMDILGVLIYCAISRLILF
ncbi:MAG: magnesium transporter [Candidatus Dependentiae bacterium]